MNEYIDEERCKKCGGKCCLIYLSVMDGGSRPNGTWFEEWCCDWEEEFKNSSADKFAPQFDPLEVHRSGNEHLWEALEQKGVNPNACNYMGKNGCLLPREYRPKACREYNCTKVNYGK